MMIPTNLMLIGKNLRRLESPDLNAVAMQEANVA